MSWIILTSRYLSVLGQGSPKMAFVAYKAQYVFPWHVLLTLPSDPAAPQYVVLIEPGQICPPAKRPWFASISDGDLSLPVTTDCLWVRLANAKQVFWFGWAHTLVGYLLVGNEAPFSDFARRHSSYGFVIYKNVCKSALRKKERIWGKHIKVFPYKVEHLFSSDHTRSSLRI